MMAEQWPRNASGPGMWLVLVEEVVLRAPHVLEGVLVGRLGDLDVAHDALVLGVGVGVALELGDEQLGEDAELHGDLPPGQAGANAGERSTKLEHVLVSWQWSDPAGGGYQ